MNFLILSDGLYPFTKGGMQKHSFDLTYMLLQIGHSVKLIFCVDNNQKIPSENEVIELFKDASNSHLLKLEILIFPAVIGFPGHYLVESYIYSKNIYIRIRNELGNYDFIYAQGFTSWYLLSKKINTERMPLIGVNFHGLNMFQKSFGIRAKTESWVFRFFVKKILKKSDIIFTFGGKLREIYSKLNLSEKCIDHPIGLYSNERPQIIEVTGKFKRIVFVGRFDKVKGLDLLYDAISVFPEGILDFTFIGPIPDDSKLERKDCSYCGELNKHEIAYYLAKADALICPSLSEGMPYVILEAMSHGLIILASDVGAVSEMVSEENGILLEPGNILSITNALVGFGQLPSDQIKMIKEASLKKSYTFDWAKITIKMLFEIENFKAKKIV